jgi:hypothetical protein
MPRERNADAQADQREAQLNAGFALGPFRVS